MATIGTFKKTALGEYTGEIVTLSVQAKGVRIVPQDNRTNDNAPSHRVLVNRAEIGAAWSKTSNEPAWAAAMKNRQTMTHGATVAAHTLRSGDGGGSGASVDTTQKD